ncbi:hypothetical protein [Microbulbifer thermotolerans]|uniref:Uncharacterized protein n=1 Tax=Microbulbifer thermotolerans TaxID=252514 RepID=A0A143HQ14_MICTH|nr:hypothetical protein [Microbulbifer thermotolerans]AMX03586.1 hypothetical protein A3224_14260 [Microbulbifer thermotolerans]MCX2782152.1 hypothetical protein [Microbulbifer thermotolerans]MCX2796046.1 hypothetical protein [Microbulbifer thermotolerans]MCX2831343.1 hypothetical protein [Microbulbifer thermotolerans]MCX2835269.1 hypothetical protein [Microbulbifer thermotolerans]
MCLVNAKQLLEWEMTIDDLSRDPNMRWSLIALQNQHLYGDYKQAITRKLAKDNSDHSQLSVIAPEFIDIYARFFPLNRSEKGVQ